MIKPSFPAASLALKSPLAISSRARGPEAALGLVVFALLAALLFTLPAFAASVPPIVLKNGAPAQLQSSDTLQIPNVTGSTQCVHADASGNLTGTGSDCGSGSGTITATGTPASGNLTEFSGSASITNGDLSGDCTTSGTLAITCTKTSGSAFGTFATQNFATPPAIGATTPNTGKFSTLQDTGIATGTQCVHADASGNLTGTGADCNSFSTAATHSWTAAQRETPSTLSLSGATATPSFDASNNFTLTLVHASCPCTFANPSTTPVAGQAGVIEIIQSATGSDTTSWGTDYIAAGGSSTVTLSTAASARDYVSYYVADSTHIVISLGVANATH